jgi:hypothetical protein
MGGLPFVPVECDPISSGAPILVIVAPIVAVQ